MALRDAERFKDKIEVSLDGRQIFMLFFGGAVVACLVFVLGVMVGRRLEGREKIAHKAATSAAVDPLAALDELGSDEKVEEPKLDDLAYPKALSGEHGAAPTPLGSAELSPPKPEPHAAAKPDKPEQPAPAPAPPAVKPDRPDAPAQAAADDGKPKKFTLQISSFQDKGEADALVAKLTGQGYRPTIVTSNVEGKGVFFRVRVGEYATKDAAAAAKGDFEKKEHLLAYVTKI
jgi:cell division septation protein DedD